MLLCSFSSTTRAAETSPVILTCTPNLPSNNIEGGQFTFAAGKTLTIDCTAQSAASSDLSAMLLGKQTDAQKKSDASSTDMTLTPDTPAKATLQFPAVFQNGNYNYSFTLLDIKTHQPIAKEVLLTGVIAGDEQARITAVALNQEEYEWQAPATLDLSVTLPENKTLETSPLSLEISMSDTNGKICHTLVKNTAIKQPVASYTFKFPESGTCANTLKIVLKNQDDTVVDERMLAVGLPESTVQTASSAEQIVAAAASPMSRPVIIGLVLVVVALLTIGAISFARKQR